MRARRLLILLWMTAVAGCGDGATAIDAAVGPGLDAAGDATAGADAGAVPDAAIGDGGLDARALGVGEVCVSADGGLVTGAACGGGLVCCYPCGIPGCDSVCQVPCDGGPGCESGCPLLP